MSTLVTSSLPGSCLHANQLSRLDVFEEPKVGIAVPGNNRIADFAGQGTRTEMPGAECECPARATG
jgi:hypothetical protein